MTFSEKANYFLSSVLFFILLISNFFLYSYIKKIIQKNETKILNNETEVLFSSIIICKNDSTSIFNLLNSFSKNNSADILIFKNNKYNIITYDNDIFRNYSDTLTLKSILEDDVFSLYDKNWISKKISFSSSNNNFFLDSLYYVKNIDQTQNLLKSILYKIIFSNIIIIIIFSYFISVKSKKDILRLKKAIEFIKQIEKRNVTSPLKVNCKSDELSKLENSLNQLEEKILNENKKIQKLERVRSEFLGNVSHELRTPIFSIQGYIETLKDGAINDPEVNYNFLNKIEKHAERLSNLVSDLIEISKIESGELKLSYRFFNILELIPIVIEEMNPLANVYGVKINYKYSSDKNNIKVFADKDKIRQVLVNLIENAIKYNKKGGTVTIDLYDEPNQVNITVSDTGIGIPEEHQIRIFERFYRVDKNRSREIGGTGLGLAIVKHIIEAHKGKISVQSKVGEGSSFSFTLQKKAI